MKCIYCGNDESKVIDSRLSNETNSIRRRRECLACKKRWTTYETVETSSVLVIKKNGAIQPFDKNKLINGILKACVKRPVGLVEIETIANVIEKDLKDNMVSEIESVKLGDMVLSMLKPIDKISYVRFASVFKQFEDTSKFIEFLLKD